MNELLTVLSRLSDEIFTMLDDEERLVGVCLLGYPSSFVGNLVGVQHVHHGMHQIALEDPLSPTRMRAYVTVQPSSEAKRVDFVTEIRSEGYGVSSFLYPGWEYRKAPFVLIAPPPPNGWSQRELLDELRKRSQ